MDDKSATGASGGSATTPEGAWQDAKKSMEEMIVFNLTVTKGTNILKSAQDAAKAPRGT